MLMMDARSKMGKKELGKIERSGNADAQRIGELFVAASINPLHQRQGVVDEHVDAAVFIDDLLRKAFNVLFLGQIADEIRVFPHVDHADLRSLFLEFFIKALADASCAAGDDDDFVPEFLHDASSFGSRVGNARYASVYGKRRKKANCALRRTPCGAILFIMKLEHFCVHTGG